MTEIGLQMAGIGRQARQASTLLARTSTDLKNRALCAMADALIAKKDLLIRARSVDACLA
ncbi:MAG: gamma-glutamyl-phosphate reductase, partial [Proteobacteria bacterium]|nr:gamma-glutamyl-phosphate reductase [Pseudomonadota bacterium]